MTHREIAARASIQIMKRNMREGKESAEHSANEGIAFADTFERIYAERQEELERVKAYMREAGKADSELMKATTPPATPTPAPEGAVEYDLIRDMNEYIEWLAVDGLTLRPKPFEPMELHKRAEAWLSQVKPESPTRAELIEALETSLTKGIWISEYGEIKSSLEEILRRAKEHSK